MCEQFVYLHHLSGCGVGHLLGQVSFGSIDPIGNALVMHT
jgi:hypothetical protein